MTHDCPSPADLPEIAERPADDPARRHVEACPRCRARLADYRAFMAADGPGEAGTVARAVDRLGDVLDREILGDTPAPAGRVVRLPWRSPWARSALAAAAVLLLFFAVDGYRDRPGCVSDRVRAVPGEASPRELLAPTSEARPDGGIVFRWRPLDEADGYAVRLLTLDLDPVAVLPAGAADSLAVDAARLRELVPEPGVRLWGVVAYKGEDVVLHGDLDPVRVDAP